MYGMSGEFRINLRDSTLIDFGTSSAKGLRFFGFLYKKWEYHEL